ncbi:aminotransferase class I/II-fold pyridoxal phosphate-dependent enzyme [Macrococcoides caseolyticum]|uniref:aminotransferase class I/II-fold pyridoxal phosphate-dependent enzyme n=1 Tax=Macrococcoides caseolyticum TaxID=69966 RepID=UPI001F2228B0|nr:aminotransferase class I/II-fold pyridoxal phosphate-dependent enzyme [Macrococcus caseolyticus]MCE4957445.1 aminotransferase class I/II-fold pyridoxal phosphate-dependent enzyme [Macrococcus caseolyticus]
MINTHQKKSFTPIDVNRQTETPLFTALKVYDEEQVISFDVPGHKRGLDKDYQLNYYGDRTLRHDINSMPRLDNFDHPTGVIAQSQQLMADLFLADDAHFLLNGTTSGIQAMILSVCKPKDKLILPRNVHKSVLNAMALADVTPIYLIPEFDTTFGIAHNVSLKSVENAIAKHPDARAIFLMNPTYFGAVSELQAITTLAHKHNMPVLVDEAHGAHFRFSSELPMSSMEAGADMAATSLHKTGGSFTQTSILLVRGDLIDYHKVKSVINMLTSTSASYLLMSSLDIARQHLALNGQSRIERNLTFIRRFKARINQVPGFHMIDSAVFNTNYHQQLDETKLTIYIDHALDLSGFEVYHLLRNQYDIQMELAEPNIIMGIVSFMDNEEVLNQLYLALLDISKHHYNTDKEVIPPILKQMDIPEQMMGLRDVFYAEKKSVPLHEALDEICAESLMIYPPGIPILMAGERITQKVIDYWSFINDQPIIKIGAENKNEVFIIDNKGDK